MMNAERFVEKTVERKYFYFQSSLKLIIFGYNKLKKCNKTYSRADILKHAQAETNNPHAKNPIEDFLRHDLVKTFLNPNRNKFALDCFEFQSGVEEFSGHNIKKGVLDIKIATPFLTEDNIYFVFECKRLNKYAEMQKKYIEEGIKRFTDRKYYPETPVTVAGMIAFIEVDATKDKKGREPVSEIADQLKSRITSCKKLLCITQKFTTYRLYDPRYKEITEFEHSYITKHIRNSDKIEISIHHLLLDYYDILLP